MNKVILLGRLIRDLELRESGDVKFTPFTLAINKHQDDAIFVDCVAFGSTAENLGKYVGRGNRVLVEGELDISSYINSQNQNVRTTNIIVNRVEFIDFKQVDEQTEQLAQPVQPTQPTKNRKQSYKRY